MRFKKLLAVFVVLTMLAIPMTMSSVYADTVDGLYEYEAYEVVENYEAVDVYEAAEAYSEIEETYADVVPMSNVEVLWTHVGPLELSALNPALHAAGVNFAHSIFGTGDHFGTNLAFPRRDLVDGLTIDYVIDLANLTGGFRGLPSFGVTWNMYASNSTPFGLSLTDDGSFFANHYRPWSHTSLGVPAGQGGRFRVIQTLMPSLGIRGEVLLTIYSVADDGTETNLVRNRAIPFRAAFVADFVDGLIIDFRESNGIFGDGGFIILTDMELRQVTITPLVLESVTVEGANLQGQTDVHVRPQINLQFNEPINPNSLGGIRVTAGGITVPITAGVDGIDPTRVNINFQNVMAFDTAHTLIIPTSVASVDGGNLSSEQEFTFTTMEEPAVLVRVEDIRFTDFSGNTITSFPSDGRIVAEVQLESLIPIEGVERDVVVILAFRDIDGLMVDVVMMRSTIGYSEEQTISIGFTLSEVTPGMVCNLFIWDDFPGMPYHQATVFPN